MSRLTKNDLAACKSESMSEQPRLAFWRCADLGGDKPQRDSEAAPARVQQNPSAALLSDPATTDDECFREDESDDGFKFSGIPIPPRSRPASEDLASRLALLRYATTLPHRNTGLCVRVHPSQAVRTTIP